MGLNQSGHPLEAYSLEEERSERTLTVIARIILHRFLEVASTEGLSSAFPCDWEVTIGLSTLKLLWLFSALQFSFFNWDDLFLFNSWSLENGQPEPHKTRVNALRVNEKWKILFFTPGRATIIRSDNPAGLWLLRMYCGLARPASRWHFDKWQQTSRQFQFSLR